MNKENTMPEKAWAYLHGEMDTQERAGFEEQMRTDADLAEKVREIRRAHRSWSVLLPLSEQSEESLEARILEDWEKSALEDRAGHDPALAARPLLQFPWWRRSAASSLVLAAAVLLIGVGIHWQTRDRLRWAEMDHIPAFRGEPGASWSEAELGAAREVVRNALRQAYRGQLDQVRTWPTPRSPWIWSVTVSPTTDHSILLEVAIYEKGRDIPFRSWQDVFAGMDELNNRAPSWAVVIMRETRPAKN